METSLVSYNPLIKSHNNTWCLKGKNVVDYSDGQAAEKELKKILLKAKDLSTLSVELDESIVDWVTEYHLSSQRANLLRGFNFENVNTALELGSGCGAITRYLGEIGVQVEAVEGNPKRAEITQLRCRDLNNVGVVQANYNDLKLPQKTYDLVFLIGVLEYAKQFFHASRVDEEAVMSILSSVRSAIKENGVIFIAIENRMGLKYWRGASEDHYGKPYVGLYGYPQGQGVRTYDKKEWENIIEKAGIPFYRFIYPFPDYKLPRVVLSDTYIRNDPFAHSSLYRIVSNDYLQYWAPENDEFLLWKTLHEANYLEEFANSFLIIISDSKERLNEIVPFDFVHFTDKSRKPQYKTMTLKPVGQNRILKHRMGKYNSGQSGDIIIQNLSAGPYYQGPLLSSVWLNSLLSNQNTNTFKELLHDYYTFLKDCFSQGETGDFLFDVTPFNIVLDSNGTYQVIDKEWVTHIDLTPEYILFRSLLWFSHYSKTAIVMARDKYGVSNLMDFVGYGFDLLYMNLHEHIKVFIEREESLQKCLTTVDMKGFIESILNAPLHCDNEMKVTLNRLVAQQHLLEEMENTMQKKDHQIQMKERHIKKIESELSLIKGSKLWRLAKLFNR